MAAGQDRPPRARLPRAGGLQPARGQGDDGALDQSGASKQGLPKRCSHNAIAPRVHRKLAAGGIAGRRGVHGQTEPNDVRGQRVRRPAGRARTGARPKLFGRVLDWVLSLMRGGAGLPTPRRAPR